VIPGTSGIRVSPDIVISSVLYNVIPRGHFRVPISVFQLSYSELVNFGFIEFSESSRAGCRSFHCVKLINIRIPKCYESLRYC
jgi:hypothetical protein